MNAISIRHQVDSEENCSPAWQPLEKTTPE
jgi:hypothetical protein